MAKPSEVFDKQVAATTSVDELGAWFERAIRPFGLTHYALGPLPEVDRESRLYLSNWPSAWIERYAINGYAAEDIAVAQARKSPEPVTWSELLALHPGVGTRLVAAAAEFGWHDGFVVPIHGPGDARGIVSLVGARLRFGPGDRERATEMARCTYHHSLTLYVHRTPPSPLTGRERDALVLVAQGKDDREISAALGVTQTSAHAYVERAKKRLGATTRAQAVALALANNLIRP